MYVTKKSWFFFSALDVFLQVPLLTSFKLQVAFPELTLCPSEPYREEQLKIHGIASRFGPNPGCKRIQEAE